MGLAQQAATPVPVVMFGNAPIPVAITCHVAVWFWAAQEAQARGLTGAKAPATTLQRIAGLPGGPQAAMMNLGHAGAVNYGANPQPALPPPGTVLRWSTGATHVAVVTGPDAIVGYNQGVQFVSAVGQTGRTQCRRADMAPGHRLCYMIPEATLVNAAGAHNL